MKRLLLVLVTLCGLAALTGTAVAATTGTTVTVVAVGDIACANNQPVTPTTCQEAATERDAAGINPRYALLLGDLAYPSGNFSAKATPLSAGSTFPTTWGKIKPILRPTPGNHDGTQIGFSGYYNYFGDLVTPTQPGCRSSCGGWYSFNTGSWHIVSLNTSSCSDPATTVSTCPSFAAQLQWLNWDLAEHQNKCAVAFMHNPLFAAGISATPGVKPLWDTLQKYGVDLVLAGHAHNYERFAPQLPTGTASASGITELVAGTGGVSEQPLAPMAKNEKVQFDDFGVLKLALAPGKWTSSFHSISGAVRDTVTTACH